MSSFNDVVREPCYIEILAASIRCLVGFRRPLHLRDTQKLADIFISALSRLSVVNDARPLLARSDNPLLGPRRILPTKNVNRVSCHDNCSRQTVESLLPVVRLDFTKTRRSPNVRVPHHCLIGYSSCPNPLPL